MTTAFRGMEESSSCRKDSDIFAQLLLGPTV